MTSSAEECRLQGNKYFQAKKYDEAVSSYSSAISKNPVNAIYFTNRALCYIQMNQHAKALTDSQKAAELDKTSVKAFYFWGKAALQLEQYDEAIKVLTKAIDLSVAGAISFGDEIHNQLRVARKEKFRLEENKRIQQEIELVTYVKRLIQEDTNRKLEELSCNDDGDYDKVEESEKLTSEAKNYENQLENLLAQVDDRRRRREIPDYLCGKISFELLKDPVITPSGITYDRADIKQHLQRVGHFDPVTMAALQESDLIPNLAMKEVVEAFIADNPWAEHEDT